MIRTFLATLLLTLVGNAPSIASSRPADSPDALLTACSQDSGIVSRWKLGDHAIIWTPSTDLPHEDHLEMSGEQISCVLRWGVNPLGQFRAERSLVFPRLRVIPNNTYGQLKMRFSADPLQQIRINDHSLICERTDSIRIDGTVQVYSSYAISNDFIGVQSAFRPEISVLRTFYPSTTLPCFYEQFTITNCSGHALTVNIPSTTSSLQTDPAKGVDGTYTLRSDIQGAGRYLLQADEQLSFCAVYQAYKDACVNSDFRAELAARQHYLDHNIAANLQLITPDASINEMFHFAKIRAAESIYSTRGGYMHSPGGETYYAALWANDQAEYANPFFPFLGYELAAKASLNCFRHYARFINDEYKPIPSSIIAEGLDIWAGAGDRGDAAMLAYGASRYALASGSREVAQELFPLIQWCLEYCRRQLNPQGVVLSDTDELEGRFPAGEANLCTSTLYYDALISAHYLCSDLGIRNDYLARSRRLAKAIDKYFAAEISGYQTYRYYNGNTTLRSWICMPLIMGLDKRAEGTVQALTSPKLLTDNGLLTEEGSDVFWDRSTLYALRGIYYSGYADKATEVLHSLSTRRLLGDHVPYSIEAWPEGSQRHLSAESALYCRVITEGLFGLRPCGLHSMKIKPSLPSSWNEMSLRHIRACGSDFDLYVSRLDGQRLLIQVLKSGTKQEYIINEREEISIKI